MVSAGDTSLPRAVDRARKSMLKELGDRAARHFWRVENFLGEYPSDNTDVISMRAFDLAVQVLRENEPLEDESPVSYAARVNERLLQRGEERFRDGAGSYFLGTIHVAIKTLTNSANEWAEKVKDVEFTHRHVSWAGAGFVYAEYDSWTSLHRIVLWRPGEASRCLPVEGKLEGLDVCPNGEQAVVVCGGAWLVDLHTGDRRNLGRGHQGEVVVAACAYALLIAGSESPKIDWISLPNAASTSFEIERLETDARDDVDLGVRAMTISSDGAWLCLQDTGETRYGEMNVRHEPAKVRLYDLSTGRLRSHVSNVVPVAALVFSGDGAWVLAPGHRLAVPSLQVSNDAPHFVRAVPLPGSTRFVIDDGRSLAVYDAATATTIVRFGDTSGRLDALCLADAAEGRVILLAVCRGAVAAWCVRDPQGPRPQAELDPEFLRGETRLPGGIAGAIR